MVFKVPAISELNTESDVEQKFVMPLLTMPLPDGLGFASSDIQTKANIRRFKIGKGSDQKLYFPDYIVALAGYPLVVIEAKEPRSNLIDAFREARLYAHELNAVWPSGINPTKFVLATDGHTVVFGTPDQAAPQQTVLAQDINAYSESFVKIQDAMSKVALQKVFSAIASQVKPSTYRKPRRLLGGQAIQNEEIGHNSFGATIAADFSHIFNPTTREDRNFIAKYGYVSSKRRERYIDPIDRVIRASRPPSQVHSTEIADTTNPREIFDVLRDAKPLEHQVLLIVGSVGSGKTTFVDHLETVALPGDLQTTTLWLHIDMNAAPISAGEIYNWLRSEIISGCQAAYPDMDFDELEKLKKIFAVQVNRFQKGTGSLYADDHATYKAKLAELLDTLNADLHQKAIGITRYCATERGKLAVIVLDNCDKRTRDEQLLMFQATQWLQREFRTLVILPLREETYDNHRDQPPLDTALKNLVFRIEPPLFHHLLVERVQLTLNQIAGRGDKLLRFNLPNGFHVEYAASDQAFYLTSIIHSIFEYDRYIRRMIVGLSGRNMRRALEIFLEFCTSGHISEDQILRIRQNNGQHVLPFFIVMRVLLRMNRRYYDSDYSYLKNVFAADRRDSRPNYFTRLIILRWLQQRVSMAGPTGLKGYFQISQLKYDLIPVGIEELVLNRELEILVKAQCILTEDLRTEGLTDEMLIRLASPGFVHLEMISTMDYLAAVAEDTWFADEGLAQKIAQRIRQLDTQYELNTALANARDLVDYLHAFQEADRAGVDAYLDPTSYVPLTELTQADETITHFAEATIGKPWLEAERKLVPGTEWTGTIINSKEEHGLFVELEPGITGLLHKSRLPSDFRSRDHFAIGETIQVAILHIDATKHRLGLRYAATEP